MKKEVGKNLTTVAKMMEIAVIMEAPWESGRLYAIPSPIGKGSPNLSRIPHPRRNKHFTR